MAKFLTKLETTPLPDGVNHQLVKPLHFLDDDGTLIIVPAGFITDFASFPRLAFIGGMVILFTMPFLLAFIWLHWLVAAAVAGLIFANGLFVVLVAEALELDDLIDPGATVHDFGYRVKRGSKMIWDGRLYRAMKATNRPLWKRIVVYEGVNVGGFKAWRDDGRLLQK